MPAAVRRVPFAGATIPIVSPEHLVIRKVMLDRPKDWLDIEAILAAETPLDLEEVRDGSNASPAGTIHAWRSSTSCRPSRLRDVTHPGLLRAAAGSATIVIASFFTRPAGIEGSPAISCWRGPRFSRR